jgi:hypothetical protein
MLPSGATALMSLHPATQQLIRQVEQLSGKPVHVQEDATLKTMAKVSPARGEAPAHFLSYRPGTQTVDYLMAYQLGFLVRLYSCPAEERREVKSLAHEQQQGIEAMGLANSPPDFAVMMITQITTQVRTYPVGARVDQWIWQNLPALREQQEHSVRAQLAENARALAPEICRQFPKPLVDANTAMNAAYAELWSVLLDDARFSIPHKALGYGTKAGALLAALRDVPDDPVHDNALIERWADLVGLTGSFHFSLLTCA